jgi:hypothetical protein
MNRHACLFEAKSIQDYILRSGRLRHIVGASELIDALTRQLLDDVLTALGLSKEQIVFSRRAGGAIYAFSGDPLALGAFRDLWTLVVSQYAPGLEFVIATGRGETDYLAYRDALAHLQAGRNRQPAALPAGTPVTRYAPRTGRPAVTASKGGLLDASTARFEQESQTYREDGLSRRFDPESRDTDWPRNLEYNPDPKAVAFPFLGDSRYLGLIHADGNGLGQLLMNLGAYVQTDPHLFADLFLRFSTAIEQATQAAAREATRLVLAPARSPQPAVAGTVGHGPYPARPIVLGGDDLTILVRADLALPFTRAFLQAFERCSGEELARLRADFPRIKTLPEALTAGAGIAFVKSSHPFYLAHDLAESLARFAKDQAKQHPSSAGRIPPTLCFHRVTSASHGDYADIRARELTFAAGEDQIITTLGAYGIDPPEAGQVPHGLPVIDDLDALASLLGQEKMARGPARQILTLIGQDMDDARRRYTRWREVMKERDATSLDQLLEHLTNLCGTLDDDLPIGRPSAPTGAGKTTGATPLGDVANWLAVTKGAVTGGTIIRTTGRRTNHE